MKPEKQLTKQISSLHFAYVVTLMGCLFASAVGAVDVIHGDDVIVEGRLCSSDGDFCADGENFLNFGPSGAQLEIKVKDNHPAIGFETTDADTADWVVSVLSEDFIIENDESNSTPFTIQNGAANDALFISEESQFGINQGNPNATLDVIAPFGQKAALKVTNGGGPDNGLHTILNLASNGPPSLRLRDNFNNETWQFRAKQNGGFTMNNAATPGLEMEIEKDGRVKFRNDVSVNGVVVHASSKTIKENFKGVDAQGILEKVNALPIQQWNYIRDEDTVKHIGPMAEDFYQTFKLGATQKGISSVDVSGIALIAIQGLKKEKDNEVGSLQQLLDAKNEDIQTLNVTLNENKVQLLTLQRANDEKEKRISKLEEQLDRLNALEHAVSILIDRPFDGLQQAALAQQ